MVIFQGAAETSSISAALAALEIRKKTDEINEELKSRFPKVQINMGINSGMASVGMTKFEGSTGTRMMFTATGPVTNLAARIAAAAQNGDILIGPETAKYVKERVQLFERGLMEFKNVSEPIKIFSLLRSNELEPKAQC
jgi:class 3 adenylate cyclase